MWRARFILPSLFLFFFSFLFFSFLFFSFSSQDPCTLTHRLCFFQHSSSSSRYSVWRPGGLLYRITCFCSLLSMYVTGGRSRWWQKSSQEYTNIQLSEPSSTASPSLSQALSYFQLGCTIHILSIMKFFLFAFISPYFEYISFLIREGVDVSDSILRSPRIHTSSALVLHSRSWYLYHYIYIFLPHFLLYY